MDDNQLLTPEQAARILKLEVRHLLRMPIRRVRLGHRTLRYRRDDIAAYVDQMGTWPKSARRAKG